MGCFLSVVQKAACFLIKTSSQTAASFSFSSYPCDRRNLQATAVQ
jgi:hypothetical protein